MDQFFQLIDWDSDGRLGLIDIAIAHVHCWLSGPATGIEVDNIYRIDASGRTTFDELTGHLSHLFPKRTAEEVIDGLMDAQGAKRSAFVCRADVLNWLDLMKNNAIH
jgi:hypothetical protein